MQSKTGYSDADVKTIWPNAPQAATAPDDQGRDDPAPPPPKGSDDQGRDDRPPPPPPDDQGRDDT
jgi:hypothetical protein